MNAPFDPVTFIHRLEAEGIARGAAEAIAQGIEDRNRELATKSDLEALATKSDVIAARSELKLELQAALARQTVQFGAMLAAAVGLAAAIVGVIVGLK